MANCHFWQCLIWAIFDVQTSPGCLKVSEFYQESDSEVKNHLRQCLGTQIKVLQNFDILPCISPCTPDPPWRFTLKASRINSFIPKYLVICVDNNIKSKDWSWSPILYWATLMVEYDGWNLCVSWSIIGYVLHTPTHDEEQTVCVFCVGDICDLAHDSSGGESWRGSGSEIMFCMLWLTTWARVVSSHSEQRTPVEN